MCECVCVCAVFKRSFERNQPRCGWVFLCTRYWVLGDALLNAVQTKPIVYYSRIVLFRISKWINFTQWKAKKKNITNVDISSSNEFQMLFVVRKWIRFRPMRTLNTFRFILQEFLFLLDFHYYFLLSLSGLGRLVPSDWYNKW